jgi:hypothetical protein
MMSITRAFAWGVQPAPEMIEGAAYARARARSRTRL